MKKYKLEVELASPALAGSGVGFGASIDLDIVFDELGIPFIPAKRIKGCLRDSVTETREMFGYDEKSPLQSSIDETFGKVGALESAPVYFSNLAIEDYTQNRDWLRFFVDPGNYGTLVTSERILESFTEVYHHTRIDDEDGAAAEHSLRTIRVLKKGLKFSGTVSILDNEDFDRNVTILTCACLNFRRFGTKRNRGFGKIQCKLRDENGILLNAKQALEGLCTA